MLIGKRHRIIKGLQPTCDAINGAIKKAYDNVKQPDSFRAIDTRDAILNILAEMDKVLFYMAERSKQKKGVVWKD